MSNAKTDRLNTRLTPEQSGILRHAAEITGTNVSSFTLSASLLKAREVIADQRLFELDDATWTEFQTILERPIQHKPRLEKLFDEDSVFE